MAEVHKRLLLPVLLAVTLAAGCDKPAASGSAASTAPPVTTVTPSAPGTSGPGGPPPSGGSDTPTSQASGFPHAEGPIAGTVVETIAGAWAKQFHKTPVSAVVLGSHRHDLTIDFPDAHAKLAMNVGNRGADTGAAEVIYCQVTNASLAPKGFLTLTRTAVEHLVADCPGPALKGGEAKQIADFVAAHDKPDSSSPCNLPGLDGQCRSSDHRVDLQRFQVVVQTAPTLLKLYVVGR
jgi:hypothetical protein